MNKGKILRKSLCIALAAVAIGGFAAAVPAFTGEGIVAEAASTLSYGDYSYKIVGNDYAVITKYVGKDANVVVPESIHDFKVISINSGAFSGNELMETVELPEGVTEIGAGAFYACPALRQVTIPNTVASIGYRAFYNCSSLESVVIPASVKTLGTSVFNGCVSLKEVTIEDETEVDGDTVFFTEIPNSTFKNCYSLEKVEMPESVNTIGFSAFENCTNLESFRAPFNLTSIGSRAFANCISLSEVDLGSSLTEVGLEAFFKCSKLMSVEIPASVQKIGLMAFGYTYNGAVKKYIPHPDFKMTVHADTAGQAYAVKNGFQFEVLQEPLTNMSEVEATEFNLGEPVVMYGKAEGGFGEYTYSYYYKRSVNSNWKLIGEKNTTETTASFTPTAETFYDVMVVVTDSEGNEAEMEAAITPNKNTMVNFSYLASSKVALGKNVKVYGNVKLFYRPADGEEMPEDVTYSYYFRRSGNAAWKTIGQEETTNESASFKPSAAGTYEVKVVANFGTLSEEKTMTVTVE